MSQWEPHLARWLSAGLIDQPAAERIRAFEAAGEKPAGQRWQVLVALILGGILLAAGVLLFVAAHWTNISPIARLLLVLALLAALHLGAIAATERFPGMATVLHGVGTIGCGAAIAMVGQIFNMQEHWPGAILLWALCAAAGWWFLRDQFQQVCMMLLVPAWIICEWTYRASIYSGSTVYLCRMIGVIAAVYLVSFLHSRRLIVFGILFAVAAIALITATAELADGWTSYFREAGPLPWSLRIAAFVIIALALVASWLWERRGLVPVLLVTAMVFAMPWLQKTITEQNEYSHMPWTHTEPSIFLYALVATVAMILAWWGVQQRSKAIVNYAIAMFAITVSWFYFSSLMDKLGRSLGLIGLGVLFLLGGWMLERMRRRMLQHMFTQEAPAP